MPILVTPGENAMTNQSGFAAAHDSLNSIMRLYVVHP